jgi:hypothetical protein
MIKRRKPIARISKRRSKQLKEYKLLRDAFLEAHPYCQLACIFAGINEQDAFAYEGAVPAAKHIVNGVEIGQSAVSRIIPYSQDIHHTRGRYGGNYLNTDTWMAVCRENHIWIHNNPAAARKLNLLAPKAEITQVDD